MRVAEEPEWTPCFTEVGPSPTPHPCIAHILHRFPSLSLPRCLL
jgi:hypothetical protein